MLPRPRSALAVILGLVVAGSLIAAVDAIGHCVYPPKIDFSDRLAVLTGEWPLGGLLYTLLAWGVGTFTGTASAAWVAGRTPYAHARMIGGCLALAAQTHLHCLPRPLWFGIATIAIVYASAALGAWVARVWLLPEPTFTAQPSPSSQETTD